MDVPEVDVDALEAHLAAGGCLIDVREPDEHTVVRVPSGLLIPLATVPDRIAEIPDDRSVYVVCAKGGRSRAAVEFLREQGYEAVNVSGGTEAWVAAGKAVETGEPS